MISRKPSPLISRIFLLITTDCRKYHEFDKWNGYIEEGLMNLVTLQNEISPSKYLAELSSYNKLQDI